jgi:DNA-binding MarR family transcriptional regulator
LFIFRSASKNEQQVGSTIASHLVDRLVLRTEDPLDRRRTLAQLSPSGEELAEWINQVRFGTLA